MPNLVEKCGTRKIPPLVNSSQWIPPDQIPPNLTQTLTLTQLGIPGGGLTIGDFLDTEKY